MALLTLLALRGPLIVGPAQVNIVGFVNGSFFSHLLLLPEGVQLLRCLFADSSFLCSCRLQHRVQELRFVVVQGAELVLQLDLLLKRLLLRSLSSP